MDVKNIKQKEKETEVQLKNKEIEKLTQELRLINIEINLIKSSKFWKMKEFYYKIRFFVLHPLIFTKNVFIYFKIFFLNSIRTLLKRIFKFQTTKEAIEKHYFNISKKINKNDVYTLSLVVNFHKEGEIAENVIKNIVDVLEHHNKYKLWADIEIIAVLDNTDKETEKIILENKKIFNKIEFVSYGCLGQSRNHGVDSSKNNFILFADGDDYVSMDCFLALYETTVNYYKNFVNNQKDFNNLDNKFHIVVHPDYLVEFPELRINSFLNSNKNITKNNLFCNFYTSKIMCFKKILIENKFKVTTSIYGYEDWDLNNRLLAKGIKYITANYILFYRKNKVFGGLLYSSIKKKKIVRNSDLYGKNFFKNRKFISKNNFIRNFLFRKNYTPIKECKSFLEIYNEKNLLKKYTIIDNFHHYSLNIIFQFKIYEKLLDFLDGKDFVFFVPHVTLGGADKLIVEHVNSLKNTEYKPCLVTTIEPGERIKQISIPTFDIISFCPEWANLSNNDQMHILLKAIINSKIKIIHVVNSEIVLQLIKFYSAIFNEYNIKTMVSFFCPDYDWVNDKFYGFPVMYPEVMLNSDIILSDNLYWYEYFKKLAGQDFNYKKLFSPIDKNPKIKQKFSNNKKILWASRICNQKLIGVLYGICQKRQDITFIIYGNKSNNELANSFFDKILKLKNVEYRGTYNNYNELEMEEFDLLLFTSKFEGIAFVRLDMINHNVPIITSDVGDSSEIFGKNYELLVKNIEDVGEYSKKIDEFYSEPKYFYDKLNLIRKEMIKNHNLDDFRKDYLDTIKKIIN